MPRKPVPTRKFVTTLCGGNQGLLESLHHGLDEVGMNFLYPHLDFTEIVAFAAGSRSMRERDANTFDTSPEDPYELFSEVFGTGFPFLNRFMNAEVKGDPLYGKLNPFGGKSLEARLAGVDPKAVTVLRERLQGPVNLYIFDRQYDDTKARMNGDSSRIRIMKFQNAYPKRGRIVPAYASEIVRMVRQYPSSYRSLEQPVLIDQVLQPVATPVPLFE